MQSDWLDMVLIDYLIYGEVYRQLKKEKLNPELRPKKISLGFEVGAVFAVLAVLFGAFLVSKPLFILLGLVTVLHHYLYPVYMHYKQHRTVYEPNRARRTTDVAAANLIRDILQTYSEYCGHEVNLPLLKSRCMKHLEDGARFDVALFSLLDRQIVNRQPESHVSFDSPWLRPIGICWSSDLKKATVNE